MILWKPNIGHILRHEASRARSVNNRISFSIAMIQNYLCVQSGGVSGRIETLSKDVIGMWVDFRTTESIFVIFWLGCCNALRLKDVGNDCTIIIYASKSIYQSFNTR